ncbi:MAG: ComEC/Rec2 family competence protein [Micavibrio sp.]
MTREAEIGEFSGIRAQDGPPDRREAVLNMLTEQKIRLFLFAPVALSCGIGLYFGMKAEPSLWSCLGVWFLAAASLVMIAPRRLHSTRSYLLYLSLMITFLVVSGFAAAKIRTDMAASPMLEWETGPVRVEGTVENLEHLEDGKGARLLLGHLSIEDIESTDTPKRVRIKVRDIGGIRAGDRIAVLAALSPPSAPVAPYSFDFQRFAYFKQIGGFGFAYRAPELLKHNSSGVVMGLENVRTRIGERIVKYMPAREAGIANALMTGERAAITEADMNDMRNSGLVHIISISGLHITMIAGTIFFTLRLLMACFPTFAVYHPIKKYAAVGALLITILYMCLVGATVPTVRSVIMTGLVLLAIMLDRIPLSLRVVAIAALIILLIVPEALVNPSFQMSFMAVMGLVSFYEATRTFWVSYYKEAGWFRKGLIYLAGICLTTVIASVMTAPYSIYHFQQFANYGLLANLLAVPLTSFIVMPAMLLAYVLMPLGLEALPLWVMGKGLSAMLWVSHTVAGLPYAVWMPEVWPLSSLISFSLAALLLALLSGKARWLFLLPLGLGILFAANAATPTIMASGSGKLFAVYDGGQVYVSGRQTDRFSQKAWMKLWGQGQTKPQLFKDGFMDCDEWACRFERQGKKISFINHPAAVGDECVWADMVISSKPLKDSSCPDRKVIDLYDLRKEGAHAVWLPALDIVSVANARGDRPWTRQGYGR